MEGVLVSKRIGWLWMIARQHSRVVRAHPGLTSWGILSRPYGTSSGGNVHPGLTSWATLSRPFGTGPIQSTAHSARRASVGFTEAALLAGSSAAPRTIKRVSSVAARKLTGSRALRP